MFKKCLLILTAAGAITIAAAFAAAQESQSNDQAGEATIKLVRPPIPRMSMAAAITMARPIRRDALLN
jgi:hypothetical protein